MKILISETQYQLLKEDASKKVYKSYEDARDFVRSLNLPNVAEWTKYSKSGKRPSDIPGNPLSAYGDQFKGFGDWLGTKTVSSIERSKQFWPFEDAREYVRELGLKSWEDWKRYSASPERPPEIPANPHQIYADYISPSDWIGVFKEPVYAKSRKAKIISPHFLSYNEARKFVRDLNLSGTKEWNEYVRSGDKPKNIPANPREVYGDKFKSIGDWLGFNYLSFEQARNHARSMNFKGTVDYKNWAKGKNNPINLPARPDVVFRNKGWNGWKDFLRGPVDKNVKPSELKLSNDQKVKKLQDRLSELEKLLRDKGYLEEEIKSIINKVNK